MLKNRGKTKFTFRVFHLFPANQICHFLSFSETAHFATLPEGYAKSEVARAQEGKFLDVNVSVRIISFLEVDNIGQTLKIKLGMRRTWFDPRLKLLHLHEDPDLNTLWPKNYNRLWYPKIIFDNIDPSKDHDERHLGYTVLRDLNIAPILRNPGSTNATNEYKGSEHKIVRHQQYTYFWRCLFDLKWYPFDRQLCTMWMKMPKHNRNFVRLNSEKIEYKGNKAELKEYSVDEILFCSAAKGTKLVVLVNLGRPLLGSILTIFIPTFLLLLIRS